MYSALELTDNKSEIIQYNVPNLPIKASHFSQEDYPSLSIVNHWHTEFEFIYVKNAPMWYSVNGEQCRLLPGQMIFVNSGQMHYGYWEKSSNWVYDCVLFPPTLATNPVTKDLLDAVIHHAPPYLILHPEIAAEKAIITDVCELFQCASVQQEGYTLLLFSCIYRICHALWNLTQNNTEPWEPNDSKRLEAMHKMVGFIQQKYGSKIALQDIAAAGYVCRSSCCSIFKEYLNQTPNAYLTEYRISKSIELLSNPDLSVTEIAMQCGFSGSSYFTETFRKAIGCTPSDYRMRKQQRRGFPVYNKQEKAIPQEEFSPCGIAFLIGEYNTIVYSTFFSASLIGIFFTFRFSRNATIA